MKSTVILCILMGIGFGTVILVPMANAAFVCDSGWSLFRGNCYKVFNNMLTQRSASYRCHHEQACLISIHSLAEKNFVNDLLDSADSIYFWIGLKLLRSNYVNNYVCRYTDGTTVEECPIYKSACNWAELEECVVISHNREVTQVLQAGWDDQHCDLKAGFVCKKKAEVEEEPTVWACY